LFGGHGCGDLFFALIPEVSRVLFFKS
jgi:hypothetical protein